MAEMAKPKQPGFTPERFALRLKKLGKFLIKAAVFFLVIYILSPYFQPSRASRCTGDTYSIWPVFGRIQSSANLGEATNGCINVELMANRPFVLHFNRGFRIDCDSLENGVYNVEILCPRMVEPTELERREEHKDLTKGNCAESPWRIMGAAWCDIQIKR